MLIYVLGWIVGEVRIQPIDDLEILDVALDDLRCAVHVHQRPSQEISSNPSAGAVERQAIGQWIHVEVVVNQLSSKGDIANLESTVSGRGRKSADNRLREVDLIRPCVVELNVGD